MCVLVIKQDLSSEAKSFFFPGRHYGLLLFSCYSTTDTQFSHLHAMTSPFHEVTFLEGRSFAFYSSERKHAQIHSHNRKEDLFVECLQSSPKILPK